jgi:preprotein translocase subunit SecG
VTALLTAIHIIICIILIMAVLLQSGKAADLAGAFGGAGSQTVFGARGAATILSKVTTVSAVLFMITSLGLWFLSAKGEKSVVRGEGVEEQQTTAAAETKKEATEEKTQPPEKKQEPEKKSLETEKK